MKILLSISILILIFIRCGNKPTMDFKKERGRDSVVGKVVVRKLPLFHLKRDSFIVGLDTLGYYFRLISPSDEIKIITATENAELFSYDPNREAMRETIRFCSANQSLSGLKIFFQGGAHNQSNKTIQLCFVDSFVVGQYFIPFYDNKEIRYPLTVRTDSLHVILEKYPVRKGDLLRGFLYYKGWITSAKEEDNIIIAGKLEEFSGYFECKVE
jgi:hypothetical protein